MKRLLLIMAFLTLAGCATNPAYKLFTIEDAVVIAVKKENGNCSVELLTKKNEFKRIYDNIESPTYELYPFCPLEAGQIVTIGLNYNRKITSLAYDRYKINSSVAP